MVVFPNAKINLGLRIIRKREDGYHDLETIFYPIAINDGLEINVAEKSQLTITGQTIDGSDNDNLCLKAYRLLKEDNPQLPPVHIHLHKTIPTGAGLGGGSSDAAFTLIALNKKFELKLTDNALASYALQLGSDCPFFIYNQPTVAKGRGEIMSPLALSLSGYKIYIVHPGIHVSTAKAFAGIRLQEDDQNLELIIHQDIYQWKENLHNQFEATVFQQYPEIARIKNDLYAAGAIYASMSGSGSSVFGIFSLDQEIDIAFPTHYFVRELLLPDSK